MHQKGKTMRPVLLIFTLNLLTCFCQEVTVTQDRKFAVIQVGQSIRLHCKYKGPSGSYRMFWYQQKSGKGLELMGYSVSANDFTPEKPFGALWNMTRPEETESYLHCSKTTSEVSAVYFCAASYSAERQYFGSGTILTVLEKDEEIKAPKVSIYRPSKKELEDHNFISLVCVASNFFPEHVKIRWFVNDEERINLYEPIAQKKADNTFSTSKRLTLTRSEYFSPESTFRCEAAFLDGSEKDSAKVNGETDCGVSKETYSISINVGKISYIMVLCKSGLYALVVLVLVWRKKVIASFY